MTAGSKRGGLRIIWRGAHVGTLVNLEIDRSIWDGQFCAEASPEAEAFAKLATSLDFLTTINSPKSGTRVELWPIGKTGTEPIHALVLQLDSGGRLCLEVVRSREDVERLKIDVT